MKKKIIIGIVILLVVVFGLGYLFLNRTSSATESLNGFVTACNKFNLQEMSTYAEQGGDLSKLINQVQGYSSDKKAVLKDWASNVKIQIISTKKSDGDAIIKAKVYSLNGVAIYNDFQSSMQALNINNNTIQDSNLNGDYLSGDYNTAFINAVEDNLENVTSQVVEIKMKRSVGNWEIVNDDEFIKALLGGLNAQMALD